MLVLRDEVQPDAGTAGLGRVVGRVAAAVADEAGRSGQASPRLSSRLTAATGQVEPDDRRGQGVAGAAPPREVVALPYVERGGVVPAASWTAEGRIDLPGCRCVRTAVPLRRRWAGRTPRDDRSGGRRRSAGSGTAARTTSRRTERRSLPIRLAPRDGPWPGLGLRLPVRRPGPAPVEAPLGRCLAARRTDKTGPTGVLSPRTDCRAGPTLPLGSPRGGIARPAPLQPPPVGSDSSVPCLSG